MNWPPKSTALPVENKVFKCNDTERVNFSTVRVIGCSAVSLNVCLCALQTERKAGGFGLHITC